MAKNLKSYGDTAKSLASNPLGIIALFIVMVYGFAEWPNPPPPRRASCRACSWDIGAPCDIVSMLFRRESATWFQSGDIALVASSIPPPMRGLGDHVQMVYLVIV